eukprot:g67585.t1
MLQTAAYEWETDPLRDLKYPVNLVCLYLALAFLHTRASKGTPSGSEDRSSFCPPSVLKLAIIVHNVNLVVMSLLMFLFTAYHMWETGWTNNHAQFLVCAEPGSTRKGSLYYWAYMYHLSKYYELLDTLLQFLRGKSPPHFALHVYHHACIVLITWAWLEYNMSTMFIGILFNTAVHVVMYSYYLLRALGYENIRWKPYVTTFQLVQFFCSFLIFIYTVWLHFQQGCSGFNLCLLSVVFNVTLFVSFMGVLKAGKSEREASRSKRNKSN